MSTNLEIVHTDPSTLTRKDFETDQEVRWCPGCADYSILAQVQRTLPTLGIPRENYVFVSGIGCAARFPYYVNTYGMHTIHGRAPAVATGLKIANPELSVWVVGGDGDMLAIGGNHLFHALRRNVGLKILLIDNHIYGLTKGQMSPTSELGKKTKSTPAGSVDAPASALQFALGAGATFVAQAVATDPKGLQNVLQRAAAHQGTALVVVLQNCVIFNDGAFEPHEDKATKVEANLVLEHGKPMRFGAGGAKGIALNEKGEPVVVDVAAHGEANLLVHDETSDNIAFLLSRLEWPTFPAPFGVLRAVERPVYETMIAQQLDAAKASGKRASLKELMTKGRSWTVGPDGPVAG